MQPLLEVRGLNVDFFVKHERLHVINDVSFDLFDGEVLAIIGETGCGKSVTGNSILRLLPENAVCEGTVECQGQDWLSLDEEEFRPLRGERLMAIAQNPVTSLDPLMTAGPQVAECVTKGTRTRRDARKRLKTRIQAVFTQLGLSGEKTYGSYACEMSGGMCQRVLISMGMITGPKILVVDEPTKAIDWVLRRDVAAHLKALKDQQGTTMLLITHDIPFARLIADRIAVMYAGEIVEIGPAQQVLDAPLHPYTRGLIAASPANGFQLMKGHMPSFREQLDGCRFAPRCPHAGERCSQHPPLDALAQAHGARCFHSPAPQEALHA